MFLVIFLLNSNSIKNVFTGGYAYEPVPSTSSASLEDENERITDELRDKIHALKSLSIDIGAEVKYQDKLLNGMVMQYCWRVKDFAKIFLSKL